MIRFRCKRDKRLKKSGSGIFCNRNHLHRRQRGQLHISAVFLNCSTLVGSCGYNSTRVIGKMTCTLQSGSKSSTTALSKRSQRIIGNTVCSQHNKRFHTLQYRHKIPFGKPQGISKAPVFKRRTGRFKLERSTRKRRADPNALCAKILFFLPFNQELYRFYG